MTQSSEARRTTTPIARRFQKGNRDEARWIPEATAAQRQRVWRRRRVSTMPAHDVQDRRQSASMPTAEALLPTPRAASTRRGTDPREGLFHEVLNEPSSKNNQTPSPAGLARPDDVLFGGRGVLRPAQSV
jgi:hypothetical protein